MCVCALVSWTLPVGRRRKECPPGTAAWEGGSGSACTYQGSIGVASGLSRRGIPRLVSATSKVA